MLALNFYKGKFFFEVIIRYYDMAAFIIVDIYLIVIHLESVQKHRILSPNFFDT